MTTVAVLGTSTMGAGMARSLLREGIGVRAWNRTRAKADPLADDGAVICETPAEAAQGCDVVLTMLFDVESVLEVVEQAAGSFGAETVLLQTATIGPEGTARVAELAGTHGLALLDAPVLGTKGPAENGALVFLIGGDPGLRPKVDDALAAMGSKTLWVGDEVGRGSALKLVCNAWVATLNAGVAQSIAMAQGLGLDPLLFLSAIEGGGADSPYAHLKGKAMVAGTYTAAFALDGVRKDLTLIRGAAERAEVSTGLVEALEALYATASEQGFGGDDMAAVREAF